MLRTVTASVDLSDLDSRITALESRPAGTTSVTTLTSVIRASTDMGATGDGVTDDATKLQLLLDAVGQSGGGIVAVLKHHKISRALSLWSNTQLIGTGKISAHPQFTGTLAADNCYLVRNKNWAAASITDKNISVDGLTFDYGNLAIAGGGLHAVSIRRASKVTVSNCTFYGGEDAVAYLGCEGTLVDNCEAYDFINCAFDHWASPKNAVVRNCKATSGNTVQMINFNPDNTTGASTGNQAVGFKMLGNTLKYTGQGAAPCQIEPLSAGCGVSDVQVSGNTFDNTYLVARGLVGHMSVDNGNVFKNLTGGKNAILIQEQFGARPYYINVSSNIVSGATTPASSGGVITLKANAYMCAGNIVDAPQAYASLYTVDGSGIRGSNNFSVGTSGLRQIGT